MQYYVIQAIIILRKNEYSHRENFFPYHHDIQGLQNLHFENRMAFVFRKIVFKFMISGCVLLYIRLLFSVLIIIMLFSELKVYKIIICEFWTFKLLFKYIHVITNIIFIQTSDWYLARRSTTQGMRVFQLPINDNNNGISKWLYTGWELNSPQI